MRGGGFRQNYSKFSGAFSNVADPYHFDTDPDPGCEKIRYGSPFGFGSRLNFDTDLNPDKNSTDSGAGKKGFKTYFYK